MASRLGVDLGTTWTAAAVSVDGGHPEVLPLATSGAAMPSVVAIEEGGQVVAGEAAVRRLAVEPTAGVREFKRRLGDSAPLILSGAPYGAEALMAELLKYVTVVAEAAVGGRPDSLTLTHPANWGEFKLDLLREAAHLAGYAEVELQSEPAAAALRYAHDGRLAIGETAAVYDFGGGTFDAAIVRMTDTGPDVIGSPQGLERLGGVDLDQIVLAHVNTALDGKLRELDTTDPEVRRAIARLRADCTAAKEALSTDSDASISVALPDLQTQVRLTRSEFEAAIRPRLDDTLNALDRAIDSAGIGASDLAGVLMVGGSSQIPVVAEHVAQHTGRPSLSNADPKLVAVLGAASSGPASGVASAGPASGVASESEAALSEVSGGSSRDRTESDQTDPAGDPAKERGAVSLAAAASVVAGLAAGGGVAVGGVFGYRAVRDRFFGDSASDDAAESLDAFDDAFDGGAQAAGDLSDIDEVKAVGRAAAASAAEAADPVFSDSSSGRIAAAVMAPPEHSFSQQAPSSSAPSAVGSAAAAQAPTPRQAPVSSPQAPSQPMPRPPTSLSESGAPPPPPSVPFSDREIEAVRSQLQERLEAWEAPEGTDPAEADALRADLEGMLSRYQAYPGQSVDDAIASLKYEFEDRVRDFAQDQRIDAILEEEARTRAELEANREEVDGLKEQLRDRLDGWEPPEGADPGEVAQLREHLGDLLESYEVYPGQSPDAALAALKRAFNAEIGDFSQDLKIDALVEEQRAESEIEVAEEESETSIDEVDEMEAGTTEIPASETTESSLAEAETEESPLAEAETEAQSDTDAFPEDDDATMTDGDAPVLADTMIVDEFDIQNPETESPTVEYTPGTGVIMDPIPGQPRDRLTREAFDVPVAAVDHDVLGEDGFRDVVDNDVFDDGASSLTDPLMEVTTAEFGGHARDLDAAIDPANEVIRAEFTDASDDVIEHDPLDSDVFSDDVAVDPMDPIDPVDAIDDDLLADPADDFAPDLVDDVGDVVDDM